MYTLSFCYATPRTSPAEAVADDLDPVAVWVQDKREALHAALVRPLLERHAAFLKPRARRLDVVDGDGDVPEAAARVRIPRCVGEGLVRLSAVVMRELEHACVRRV
jgi:hypothetical protein